MSHSPFSKLPIPKPDPLFAIGAEAQAAGPAAINGTLGIFMDEDGKPLVFPSVVTILRHLEDHLQGFNYSYPLLTGLPAYREAVTKLMCQDDREIVASIASTGGTGALAINLRLMKMLLGEGNDTVLLPSPAWGNHPPVCKWAGLEIVEAPYIVDGKASVDAVIATVKKQTKPFGILLQIGCHNPTGLDYTTDQWRDLIDALAEKESIVLLDCAYQGFKGEPEEDAEPIRMCRERKLTTLLTWSASKNHSIYGLRTGLAAAFVKDMTEKSTVEGTYSAISRGLHSAAPTFGQAIVALVQERCQDAWRIDLRHAREVLSRKRKLMLEGLPETFHNSLSGYGMFAMLPLTETQVNRLKHDHKAFILLDGRINIGGIPESRIKELCEKIEQVL